MGGDHHLAGAAKGGAGAYPDCWARGQDPGRDLRLPGGRAALRHWGLLQGLQLRDDRGGRPRVPTRLLRRHRRLPLPRRAVLDPSDLRPRRALPDVPEGLGLHPEARVPGLAPRQRGRRGGGPGRGEHVARPGPHPGQGSLLGGPELCEDASGVAAPLRVARDGGPRPARPGRGPELRRPFPAEVALLFCLLRGRLRGPPHRHLPAAPPEVRGGLRGRGGEDGEGAEQALRRGRDAQGPGGAAGASGGRQGVDDEAAGGLGAAAARPGADARRRGQGWYPLQARAEDPRGGGRPGRGGEAGEEDRVRGAAAGDADRHMHRGGERAALRGAPAVLRALPRASEEVQRVHLPPGRRQCPGPSCGRAAARGRGPVPRADRGARRHRGRHVRAGPRLRLGLLQPLPCRADAQLPRRRRVQQPRAAGAHPRGGQGPGPGEPADRHPRCVEGPSAGARAQGPGGGPLGARPGRARGLRPLRLRGDDGAHEEL
mmetsp:Transcript_110051/g.307722  ORF Transcript_110051/g.307722 Transcript_110051/m.307722 type:complete len:486 (-) Transcript_110051:460-1917(-)